MTEKPTTYLAKVFYLVLHFSVPITLKQINVGMRSFNDCICCLTEYEYLKLYTECTHALFKKIYC